MAPVIVKPENALKRADELVNVDQSFSALQHLHEAMTSKKYRTYTDAHETLMIRLIDLCVELRKGKHAREALHAFKNLCQNVNVRALENVVTHYFTLAENRVTLAQEKAEKVIDQIDDLEESETPESIMLSTVSAQGHKDRTDREVVTPWLKFLWETYRTTLDVLKYNSKLEVLYQQAAHKAFDFCLKFKRKMEMRRLCELLRNHLTGVTKYTGQANSIDLNSSESLQMHLDTRFIQLNAASSLELWQEAFRSVEDIHGLVTLSKMTPPRVMAINFYNQLIKIFWVSDNYLFHAASWAKFYVTSASFQEQSSAEIERLASMVLLSALAVPSPPHQGARFHVDAHDSEAFRQKNLMRFLGLSVVPTRQSLIDEVLDRNLLKLVSPELRELYEVLEVSFHPLMVAEKMKPLVEKLSQDPEMAAYIRPVYNVMFTRLLEQLSTVYSTVKLSKLSELAAFPAPYNQSDLDIQMFILRKCRKGELSARIDHLTNSLSFDTDLLKGPYPLADNSVSSLKSDQMKTQLFEIASNLSAAVKVIKNVPAEKVSAKNLEEFYANVEEERQIALARKFQIERRKEIIEAITLKKEREEAHERAVRAQQEAEAEKKRLEEESRRREIERLKRERETIEKEQAQKLAEQLKTIVNVSAEDLENMNRQQLLQMQVEQLEADKKALKTRLDGIARRMDHTERAYRVEEIPLIKASYEKQKKDEREAHENAHKLLVEATRRQYDQDVEAKKRLARMKDEYEAYKQKVVAKHEIQLAELRAAAQKNIEAAKKKRIDKLREEKRQELIQQKRDALIQQKKKAEEEAAAAAEEERKQKEASVYRPPVGRSAQIASSDGPAKWKSPSMRGDTSVPPPEDRPWRSTATSGRGPAATAPPVEDRPWRSAATTRGPAAYVPPNRDNVAPVKSTNRWEALRDTAEVSPGDAAPARATAPAPSDKPFVAPWRRKQ
eukprot:Partr_v1_DN28028_c3_g1_i1_m57737 putative Component of the eukaryotic translation initiation factor 3 (eIF-3) complex, which is involved in protein synthesis and, together with other initiation factors, stimulates binding of mRNA and methionyl-tRNAi to the 40S ribosome (By similarity)